MTELLGCEQTLCVLALKDGEALLVAPHRVDDGALVHHNVDFCVLALKDGEAHQAEISPPGFVSGNVLDLAILGAILPRTVLVRGGCRAKLRPSLFSEA